MRPPEARPRREAVRIDASRTSATRQPLPFSLVRARVDRAVNSRLDRAAARVARQRPIVPLPPNISAIRSPEIRVEQRTDELRPARTFINMRVAGCNDALR